MLSQETLEVEETSLSNYGLCEMNWIREFASFESDTSKNLGESSV